MNEQNNGGPAFPLDYETAVETQNEDSSKYGVGMTLRDYFAAKAINHVFTSWEKGYAESGEIFMESSDTPETKAEAFCAAKDCYLIADAMLEARVNTNA